MLTILAIVQLCGIAACAYMAGVNRARSPRLAMACALTCMAWGALLDCTLRL